MTEQAKLVEKVKIPKPDKNQYSHEEYKDKMQEYNK